MAHSGDVLLNPVTGHRYHVVRSAADTGGQLLEMEVTYPPGAKEPPDHFHPRQEERFELLEGSLRVRVAGGERELRPGGTLVIPAGVPHAMWNTAAVPARVRWETRPALRTEYFFEELVELARRGRVNAEGTPGLLDLALLVPKYRDEMRMVRPPAWVQRIVFGILAPIARMRARGAVA